MDHHGFDHTSWHEGVSLGDLMFALSAGMGYSGHSLSLADTVALGLAAQMVLDYGRSGREDFQLGHVQDVLVQHSPPAHHGPDGAVGWADPGREICLPGVSRDATTVEVLCWPHGCRELWRAGQPWAAVDSLAAEAGLQRFAPNIASLPEIERSAPQVLTAASFRGADRPALPNGWYQGVQGRTTFWRHFYRVPPRGFDFRSWLEGVLNVGPRRSNDERKRETAWRESRTFLVVTGATWHYHISVLGDYETWVAFSVYSLPFVNPARQWTYFWEDIAQYRALAERLAGGLRRRLDSDPPEPESVRRRRSMDPALTRRPSAPKSAG